MAAKNLTKLTILHSNDMHGDFLAENVDEKLVGGVSYLSGYINKVRAEEDNVLYCVAGDMFRGSIIDSEFKGLSTVEIMNMLAPDIVTLGNHETDYGVTHLLFIEKMAKFPIINANLHISTNGARLFKPYEIIEIGGMKILFIGILTEEVIAQTKNMDGMIGSLVNVEDAADEVGKICNAHNAMDIDFTVLLTHIGYEKDIELARLLDPSWGVDVIIGGHSHTLPEKAIEENGVLIVQAGTGTDQIGRFDILIDTDRNAVDSYEWRTVPVNAENCPYDEEIEKLISGFKDKTDAKYNRVITRFSEKLTHPTRYRETQIGDLFADLMKDSLGTDAFLMGSGSIRTKELGPIVTLQSLMENFPYDDPVYMFRISGKHFKAMMKYMLRDEALLPGAHTEFYQLSKGIEIVYNQQTHSFEKFNFMGVPLEDDKVFSIGMQKYHFSNFTEIFDLDINEVEKEFGKARVISTSCFQVIQEYLEENQLLYQEVEGRLVIK